MQQDNVKIQSFILKKTQQLDCGRKFNLKGSDSHSLDRMDQSFDCSVL